MLTPLRRELEETPDLAHQARQFRTVLASFKRNVDLLYAGAETQPQIDSVAVAKAFAQWRQDFEASRSLAAMNRSDFVVYSAGSMLKELLRAKPLQEPRAPSAFAPVGLSHWPEGYAYVSFCLSVASGVLHHMGAAARINEELGEEAGFWDSFRENALEDVGTAQGFFDLICGLEPNWEAPDVAWARPAMQSARLGLSPDRQKQL